MLVAADEVKKRLPSSHLYLWATSKANDGGEMLYGAWPAILANATCADARGDYPRPWRDRRQRALSAGAILALSPPALRAGRER